MSDENGLKGNTSAYYKKMYEQEAEANRQLRQTVPFFEKNSERTRQKHREELEEKDRQIKLLEHLRAMDRTLIDDLRRELSRYRLETNPDDIYDFC